MCVDHCVEVWGRSNSANVQRVLWMCGEVGLRVKHYPDVDVFGGLDSAGFRSLNPNGRVPVLRDSDGFVGWESASIVRYVAARYGAGEFSSNSPRQQSMADRWMDWYATMAAGAMTTLWRHYGRGIQYEAAIITEAANIALHAWNILSEHLSDKEYIAGKVLSVGDIPVGVAVHRWFQMQLDDSQPKPLAAWYQRLLARPAYRRFVVGDP